jgi:hypothetical protein
MAIATQTAVQATLGKSWYDQISQLLSPHFTFRAFIGHYSLHPPTRRLSSPHLLPCAPRNFYLDQLTTTFASPLVSFKTPA